MQSSEIPAHFRCRHGWKDNYRNVDDNRNAPDPVVSAFHETFKLSDIKVTDARHAVVDKAELAKMKGKLVVFNDGKEQLIAAYLAPFREDTIVISRVTTLK